MDMPKQTLTIARHDRMKVVLLALMFASVLAFRETAPAEAKRARKTTRKGE